MALMPEETVLLYNERAGISGQLNHTNAFRFFEKITPTREESFTGCRQIMSNTCLQGKSVGFSTIMPAHQAILLADYFGLTNATGMPLENSYLFHGYKMRFGYIMVLEALCSHV